MIGSKLFRIFRICYYCVISLLLARLVNSPVILCFHRVGKSSGSLLDRRIGVTDPDSFRNIIKYLRILGYRFVSLKKLTDSIERPRLSRVAVVTFDDGYKDLYQNAFPILKGLNIPFTLFLTTSTVESERLLWLHKLYITVERLSPEKRLKVLKQYNNAHSTEDDICDMIGRIIDSSDTSVTKVMSLKSSIENEADTNKEEELLLAKKLYLTKAELMEMQRHGLSIEVHGHEHLPPASLRRAEIEKEILTSVTYVVQELNGNPKFYSLPYGISNRFVIGVARDLKLSGIATTEGRLVGNLENIFRLPRFCVTTDDIHFYRRLARSHGKTFMVKMKLLRQNNNGLSH